MREFSNDMDMDGKAPMVETVVRNTAVQLGGEVDRDMRQHMLQSTRVWTSDGAVLDVGLALASGRCFSSLVCHCWGESHSAGRLMANALRHDAEVQAVDHL